MRLTRTPMKHRARILTMLANLPVQKRMPRTLSRSVLEGAAKTDTERCAAPALIDYMLAMGELVPHGGPRNRTYGLPNARKS